MTATNKARRVHDGTATDSQTYTAPASRTTETNAQHKARADQASLTRGLHESFDYYDDCNMRTRNKGKRCTLLSNHIIGSLPIASSLPRSHTAGLFTADQNLGNNNFGISSAAYTRQNANGNRRGYECPEERDYYPYWHPSPWIDVAILTDNVSRCAYYQAQSFNVMPKGLCRQMYSDGGVRPWSEFNTYSTCVANGGKYMQACVGKESAVPCVGKILEFLAFKTIALI